MALICIERGDGKEFERVVMGEVVIPDTLNVYGDLWTREGVRDLAYIFAMQGYGIDVEHAATEQPDVYVVESFIARAGDPDFIEGSWVVAMKVLDDAVWQKILDNEIAGFSYEAVVEMVPTMVEVFAVREVEGLTEPDPFDGHQHPYMVLVNALGRPVAGGTSEVDGHSHTISTHTVTDVANRHSHRYQVHVKE